MRHPASHPRARHWLRPAAATLAAVLAAGHAAADMQVTFTGNNGVMLQSGGRKILIDTIWNHNNTFWTRLSAEDRDKMIAGQAPFDGIDYALTTHNHPDHWSLGRAVFFAQAHPDTKLIAPPQALSGPLLSLDRVLDEVNPAFQTESVVIEEPGLRIEVFHMEHFDQFGNDFSQVQDFTYLITMGGVSLLHLGDVDFIAENFENFDLASRGIDAVVLPTFNTLVDEANRELIEQWVNPGHIIATHLRAGLLAQEEAAVRAVYPDATIFTTPLESITIVPEPGSVTLGALVLALTTRRRR